MILMVSRSDIWVNFVLFSVLVLLSVCGFVVLSWACVGVDWLSVGVLVDIYDWVLPVFIGVMRVSSWVGIDGLIIMVDLLVVEWLNFVGSVVFDIMTDSFMWGCNIIFCHVVVMMVVGAHMMTIIAIASIA